MTIDGNSTVPLPRRAYSVFETAEMLGVSYSSIYRLVHAGKLRPLGFGQLRFSSDEIDRFLKVTRDVSIRGNRITA
jgi:excisionase family DNA binding protein